MRLDSELSPGAACWNLFTNNGKFLYVTNPAGKFAPGGANVTAFQVDRDGQMTLVDKENTPFEAIDNALSHGASTCTCSRPTSSLRAPQSAINASAIDRRLAL